MQTDGQNNMQTDGQNNMQTDRQIDTETDRQTHTHTPHTRIHTHAHPFKHRRYAPEYVM